MVTEGDRAPDFTAPLADGSISEFTLSERLDEAPLVLAFFPGAFTTTCSHEMNAFQARLDTFRDAGAAVYGVSTDSPTVLNEFRDHLGLEFDLISDDARTVVEKYDVATDFDHLGVVDAAKRAVFVVDGSGTVTYAWVSDEPDVEPDYDEIEETVRAA